MYTGKHHHGSTVNRKHSQFDAYISVRVRRTDLATVGRWLLTEGQIFPSKSQLVQACIDLAVRFVISQGADHVSSTEEAAELLNQWGMENLNPAARGQFAYIRKLQEESEVVPDRSPQSEIGEIEEVSHEHPKFEDLDPEYQAAAVEIGYDPAAKRLKSRQEKIAERDERMRETAEVRKEQLRARGTLVETENEKSD